MYSDEQVAMLKGAIVEAVSKGTPISHAIDAAAQATGGPVVHTVTVWRWRKSDTEFDKAMFDAVQAGSRRLLDLARGAAIKDVLTKPLKVSAAIWIFCVVNLARQIRNGDPYDWESVNHAPHIEVGGDSNGAVKGIKFTRKNGDNVVEVELERDSGDSGS